MTAAPQSIQPITASERNQIVARLSELQAKQEAATGWGAAVGAREEEIRSLESRLLRIDSMTAPPSTETPRHTATADHPECWMARGVGSEYNLTCLVTGKTADLMPNVSGFVQGREAGERVVALFAGRARLDFRKHEPDWVQVKVGCLPEHEEVLHRLCQASWGCQGLLNERIIKWAVDPVQFPGGQPKALERANAAAAEIATLTSSHASLTAKVAELEANERAYETTLGRRTYNEVALYIDSLKEAITDLIEAIRRDSDDDGKGISGYTAARVSDAKAALSQTEEGRS